MRKNAVVAGTGFEGRDKVIKSHCKEGIDVTLKRDPKNIYDENAISVYIKIPILFGLLGTRKKQIGFVKTNTAKNLSKKIDAGETFKATVISFYAPKDREHPRVTIEITDEI